MSKLFSRPKGKEEGDEVSDQEAADAIADMKPQRSPRRQVTTPAKKEEGDGDDRGSMTPEPYKRPPPPRVKDKPVKSKSVDFGMEGRGEDREGGGEGGDEVQEKRRRPVGGVAATPLPGIAPSQLAGVLKSRPSPHPRAKVRPCFMCVMRYIYYYSIVII